MLNPRTEPKQLAHSENPLQDFAFCREQQVMSSRQQRTQRPPLTTMVIVWTVLGVACLSFAVSDIFHTLFHPAGRGTTSDRIASVVWKLVRRAAQGKHERITLAGPLAILSIMVAWVLLIVFGFAFIYLPHIASQYAVAPGLDPAKHKTFLDAFNVSLGGLVNLTGDLTPRPHILRLLLGLEGVIGFGLLTASVSWLLSIYPTLERRRALAHQATLLHHAESESGVLLLELPSAESHGIIWGLAAEIASLRNALMQFPITYYFHPGDTHSGLPGTLPYLYELASKAALPHMPASVRMAGVALGGAIDDFLEYVATTFLQMPVHDKWAILMRYADEHFRSPLRLLPPPLRRAG
jgi:hypothetical protein